jgi:hypothetical protein
MSTYQKGVYKTSMLRLSRFPNPHIFCDVPEANVAMLANGHTTATTQENFTRTLRDLRRELDGSSIKNLSTKGQVPLGIRSLLQLSNERIEKVMEEAAQVKREAICLMVLVQMNARTRRVAHAAIFEIGVCCMLMPL